ncbi:acyl-CoA N-acyltransferase [Daldinia caldariorum]|uniref:acyl-CoA N-acyltransferase n=1 Tax=Daldinia caldariorum TaxID=326644 RepID=UPI002008C608|nr:acyl-CoA N-acyltransferase [Daldinia caldariorum]KAI1466500.1 acyl-CoA N-acyltransferase [Daldinia caldariorum]
MSFTLSEVQVADAESLIRRCDFPAIQDDPLHRIMFPRSRPDNWESEIRWMANNLKNTLERGRSNFRKVCAEDGTPVGFAGWALEQSDTPQGVKAQSNEKKDGSTIPDPDTLDMNAWLETSKMLREEKRRILHGRKNIWRLMIISVDPAYQRQGVGSMLMQWGCEEADRNERDAFVLASPAAVRLYTKFGFEVVGKVETTEGTFRSMFRKVQKQA